MGQGSKPQTLNSGFCSPSWLGLFRLGVFGSRVPRNSILGAQGLEVEGLVILQVTMPNPAKQR